MWPSDEEWAWFWSIYIYEYVRRIRFRRDTAITYMAIYDKITLICVDIGGS